jgi:hypothetical protein
VLAECLERLLGLPYVEDVDSVADVEARVEGAARWVGLADGRELLVDCREISAVMPWTAK